MKFPAGSEVIFTAVNIPDMVHIVESHGLKVVPVDLDLDTLAPKPELVELAVNDKTVAILAAHLYGKWINLDKVFQVARSHGLYVLEDCAECFQGLKRKGHALSDLSFFSFGSIKHYTSLGGAVVGVKNPGILKKMRAKVEQYTVQSQWTYFKKLTSYSILMAAGFNNAFLNWFFVNSFHLLGLPYKEYMISLLRSFPGGVALSKQNLQQQPSAMLLRFLLHRLKHINEKDFHHIKLKGDFVSENLPENVFVPGKKADKNSYWLFPLVVVSSSLMIIIIITNQPCKNKTLSASFIVQDTIQWLQKKEKIQQDGKKMSFCLDNTLSVEFKVHIFNLPSNAYLPQANSTLHAVFADLLIPITLLSFVPHFWGLS